MSIRETPPLRIPNLRPSIQQILSQPFQRLNLASLVLDIGNEEIRDKETKKHECRETATATQLALTINRKWQAGKSLRV